MSNVSCTTYAGSSAVCGGHGTCNSLGQCLCDPSFTSRGDFELSYTDNCDISIVFVKVLAAVIIVGSVIQGGIAWYNVANFDDFKLATLQQDKSRLSILFGVGSLGGIIYGASRLADPVGNVVGSDVGSSVGFVVFFLFSNIGWALLTHIFSTLLNKASKVFSAESQTKIARMEAFTGGLWFRVALINWTLWVFPLAAALRPQQSDLVVIGVYSIFAVGVTTTAFLLCRVLYVFNVEIGEYIKTGGAAAEFITLRRNTVLLFYIGLYGFMLPFLPVCVIMAALPYLRRKFTYMVMVLMFNYTAPGTR